MRKYNQTKVSLEVFYVSLYGIQVETNISTVKALPYTSFYWFNTAQYMQYRMLQLRCNGKNPELNECIAIRYGLIGIPMWDNKHGDIRLVCIME